MTLAFGAGWLVPAIHWDQECWKKSKCGIRPGSLGYEEGELSKERCEIHRHYTGLELRRNVRAEDLTNPHAGCTPEVLI